MVVIGLGVLLHVAVAVMRPAEANPGEPTGRPRTAGTWSAPATVTADGLATGTAQPVAAGRAEVRQPGPHAELPPLQQGPSQNAKAGRRSSRQDWQERALGFEANASNNFDP